MQLGTFQGIVQASQNLGVQRADRDTDALDDQQVFGPTQPGGPSHSVSSVAKLHSRVVDSRTQVRSDHVRVSEGARDGALINAQMSG